MEISLEQLIGVVEGSATAPLDRISTAALLQSQVQAIGDDLLDHFVTRGREAGLSWAQIGEALGVTRQAAQQRHGPTNAPDPILATMRDSRFARFTDRARRAVLAAYADAARRQHSYIGTEHALMGLVEDADCVAAVALRRLGVDRDGLDRAVTELVPNGGAPVHGHIPFTPRTKQALENALGEALALGHNYIGTEHLVLGLHKVSDGLASRILVERGVAYEALRDQIVAILANIIAGRPPQAGQGEGG